ncbi:HAD-IA family hydrolase [Candidatus Beckwithbacteria bacterium]|nr:HAD-IA family hydrolase [Candidatus Beckwithbacteria bacterium]
MSKVKAVFFDWDGTLANTLELWFTFLKIYLPKFSEFEVKHKLIGCFDPINLDQEKDIDFGAKTSAFFQDNQALIKLNDGVFDLLNNLNLKGFKLAVLSSTSKKIVSNLLQKAKIFPMIDLFLGFEDVKSAKPDPEILFKALQDLNLTKEEVVFVGDSNADLLAGQKAQLKTYFYCPQFNRDFYQINPLDYCSQDLIFDDFKRFSI